MANEGGHQLGISAATQVAAAQERLMEATRNNNNNKVSFEVHNSGKYLLMENNRKNQVKDKRMVA